MRTERLSGVSLDQVFLNVAPCVLVQRHYLFGGTCRPLLADSSNFLYVKLEI